MNDNIYDVIISGCGPSGSLLGYLLAKDSIKPLILEKEAFPRYKTCAGGLQHRALKMLPYDISPVIEKTITGIYFSFQNSQIVLKKYDGPIIYTVKRSDFDNFLAFQAEENGCEIRFNEKVLGFELSGDYITVHTTLNKYKSRILAGADGVRGTVHRQMVNNKSIRKILGFETEISLDFEKLQNGQTYRDCSGNVFDFKDNLRLDFGGVKKGYCWVFPKKDTLSCGIGAPFQDVKRIKKYFKIFLDKFYETNGRDSKNLKISAHSIPIMAKNTPFCSERVINVGDAACIADGFTGEGLYNCFRSSVIAHSCIIRALHSSVFSFQDYFEKINNEIYREIKVSLLFTKIFYNSINLFYKLITENGNIFSSCCMILRGEKSYNDAIKRLKFFKF